MEEIGHIQNIKLVPIGNSKGIRLSKSLIQKYGFVDQLILEETDRGILIRKPEGDAQLSWEDTYKETARENEDWSNFDIALTDGLDEDDTQ
ncbi:MAG: antitoxin MazE [Candidatus Latescibacterota bacterium]|jgi:antitoxin MazE